MDNFFYPHQIDKMTTRNFLQNHAFNSRFEQEYNENHQKQRRKRM